MSFFNNFIQEIKNLQKILFLLFLDKNQPFLHFSFYGEIEEDTICYIETSIFPV